MDQESRNDDKTDMNTIDKLDKGEKKSYEKKRNKHKRKGKFKTRVEKHFPSLKRFTDKDKPEGENPPRPTTPREEMSENKKLVFIL